MVNKGHREAIPYANWAESNEMSSHYIFSVYTKEKRLKRGKLLFHIFLLYHKILEINDSFKSTLNLVILVLKLTAFVNNKR